MGSISDFLEEEFLDHVLKTGSFSPAATLYVGLSIADPLDDTSGISEPVGNGYTREIVSFGAAAARVIAQDALVTFPEASGAWGTITHWFICDHLSNTTFGTDVEMYAHGSLNSSKVVGAGNTPSIASGEMDVTQNTGGMSNYLANLFLDWAFDGGTLAVPTNLYVALVQTTELVDGDTGTSLIDLTMTDYARELHNTWNAAAGPDPMLADNNGIIDFGVLTNTAETVVAIAICDALTLGNLLFYDNTPDQLIGDGDSVNIPTGDFDVSAA